PPATAIAALYTLEALGQLEPATILAALQSGDPGVRLHGLRLSESCLDRNPKLLAQVLEMTGDPDDAVALQLALTLGQTQDPLTLEKLTELARHRGTVRWIDTAIVSSLAGRAGAMLKLLLADEVSIG